MNDMELAEEIERLVALSEKATQGKWSSEDGYLIGYPPKSRPNGEGITQFACAVDPNFPRSKADGEFVAALVNWFRANIAALRRADLAQTEIKGHMRVVDDLQGRIAELEKDAARLDYLERELEMEQELIRRGKGTDPMYPSLFRRNMPITRSTIDAALKSRV